MRTGAEVVSVADGAGAARLALANGSAAEAALVVGADGLRGRVRETLGPAVAARFTGQVAWRALVPGEGAAVAEVHMAPGRHVVTYPLAGGLRNIVAVEARRAWVEEGWSLPGDPEELRRRFAGVSPRLGAMLEAVREVHVWGLHRHSVPVKWHGQHVVLAGDSVHPTLPFLAQGANLALEDAWALAESLATLPLARALPAFEARRRARAARIVAASGRNGWVYHMPRGTLAAGTARGTRCAGGGAAGGGHRSLRLGVPPRRNANECRGLRGDTQADSRAETMPEKSVALREAPPTRAPSTFGTAKISVALEGFTEPP